MGIRQDAIAAGKTRYHGRPCPHGHGTERKTANAECVVCWRTRKHKQPSYYHGSRRRKAERKGFAPPPLESECPPRPEDGACEYCRDDTGPLCLDHDHETGAFRGWLCHKCNRADVLAGTVYEPPQALTPTPDPASGEPPPEGPHEAPF